MLEPRVHPKARGAKPAALHDVARQQEDHQQVIHHPAVLFARQRDLRRLVFIMESPAGVQPERQRQRGQHKAVIGRHHDGVGIEPGVDRVVQIKGETVEVPLPETSSEISKGVPDRHMIGNGRRTYPEEHHAHGPQGEHPGPLGPQHPGGGFLFGLAEAAVQQFFAQAVAGLQKPPDDERQRVAVPEPRKEEHCEHADLGGQARKPPAGGAGQVGPGQRHEQVVLQPGRKADVPPAPKARKVGGEEGRLEVFRQVKAQEQAHGAGDFGIARKIEVKLQRVGHRRQDQHGAAVVAVMGEHLIHQHAQHVADGHQLEQAQRHQPQAAHGAVRVKAVFLAELGHQRPGPADGALGDGGEEVQKQRAVDGVLLHLAVAACRVDQVGDGRKAVKADAQRHGDGPPARQPRKSAVVFEEGQHGQQPHDAHAQRGGLVAAFQRAAAQVGQRRNNDGDRQHGRHRHPVEQPAGRQQKGALGAPGQVQVDRGHHQQKAEKAETLQTQRCTSDKTVRWECSGAFSPGKDKNRNVTIYYTRFSIQAQGWEER